MAEYFDVLDENGNKTDKTKLREDVHKDGDWHKTVHVWIYNDKGEILLQRRCATKDSNPNKLDVSSAGHLQAGNESIEGALRELKEELDLTANPQDLTLIATLQYFDKHKSSFVNNEFQDVYILKTNKNIKDMRFQKEEISEIMFVPYAEFKMLQEDENSDLLKHTQAFKLIDEYFKKINLIN